MSDEDSTGEGRRLRRLEVLFAGAVALFAVVQALVSTRQWWVMREANRIARESMENDTRAWLTVGDDFTMPCLTCEGTGYIGFHWENSGHRPAVQVRSRARVVVVVRTPPDATKSVPELRLPPAYPPKVFEAVGVIAPGQKSFNVKVPFEDPIPPAMVDLIRRKLAGLYVYGFAKYRDGFRARRITTFCMRYEPLPDGQRFTFCPYYNVAR
jgi:hypothetical protein